MIFYTNRFVPKGAAGCARGPVILIRPEYKGDAGLLAHEKIHRLQWFLTFGLHSILYLLFDFYKLQSEVEAYKVQMQYTQGKTELFAKFIAEDYDLDITQAEALELLK
jgi:hypothetical protein